MPFQISKTPGRWAVYCPGDGFDYCSGITLNDVIITWEVNGPDDELLGIKLEPKPGGLISSIDTRPNGTVQPIPGSTTAVVWDAGDSRWETAATYTLTDDTFYTFTVTPAVTLTTGDSCNPTFSATFRYIDLGSVPTASPSISGTRQVGFTLTGSDGYSDPDGDAQDTTATIRRWYSYSNAAGTADETLVGTGSTYTLTTADTNRYIRYKVIPYAVSGPSPGPEGQSAVFGQVVTNSPAIEYTTTKTGTHTLSIQMSSGQDIAIDWGDGSALDFRTLTPSQANITKTYTAGNKDVIVYAKNDNVITVELNGENLTVLDVSNATALEELQARFNSSMTSVAMPAGGNFNTIFLDGSGMSSFDFPAGIVFDNAIIALQNTSNLQTVTFTGTGGTIEFLNVSNCDITGTLNISGTDWDNGFLYVYDNPNLTGLNTLGCTGELRRLYSYDCDLTGAISINQSFETTTIIRSYNNPNLSSFSFNVSGVPFFQEFLFGGCNITTNPDLSMVSLSGAARVDVQGSSSITNVNFGTGKSGNITILQMLGTSIGYVSLGGYKILSTGGLDVGNCNMTAAEVNEWLYNADPTAGGEQTFAASGSANFNIAGSNAAPDGTSGGFDGLTAKANLIAAGHTVTTS